MIADWLRQLRQGHQADATAPALRLERVLALDPRRRLSLVRVGGRRVLLLTGGGQDLVVGWLPDGNGDAAPPMARDQS